MRYNDDRTSAYINYALTDAYFNSQNFLGSPNNPAVVALGAQSVLTNPGATLPSVATHRFKTGFDYAVTRKWKVGGDFVYATGPYLGGDWANQFGTLSPYGVLNLRSSYNFLPNVQVYALIENVANTRTRSFGTFFDTKAINFLPLQNPAMVAIGPPTAFFAGMKWDYGNDPMTNSWIASANALYEKDRDTEIKTRTPKLWGGLYAGLNAGYGWGATTGANTSAFGIEDAWSNAVNSSLTSKAETSNPWSLSNTGAMAMANTGLAQVARNGFIGGGQFGYNYQDESDVVLGAEADLQATTFSGTGSYTNAVSDSSFFQDNLGDAYSYYRSAIGGGKITADVNWMGTFRARLGYALTPSILAYGTGGLAYGAVRASTTHWTSAQTSETEPDNQSATQATIPGFSNYTGFRAGWIAGGGIEWMLRDNWSLRAEGLYYNLGAPSFAASPIAVTCSGIACAGAAAGSMLWASTPITKIQFDGIIARAGVNYHFDWGKADTVAAKY
ncbi:MAG: hypothetical protein EB015_18960 [Methylocystaceae bacterium]|nr:hypothetical protein [Methylocystaceae bacterium]